MGDPTMISLSSFLSNKLVSFQQMSPAMSNTQEQDSMIKCKYICFGKYIYFEVSQSSRTRSEESIPPNQTCQAQLFYTKYNLTFYNNTSTLFILSHGTTLLSVFPNFLNTKLKIGQVNLIVKNTFTYTNVANKSINRLKLSSTKESTYLIHKILFYLRHD